MHPISDPQQTLSATSSPDPRFHSGQSTSTIYREKLALRLIPLLAFWMKQVSGTHLRAFLNLGNQFCVRQYPVCSATHHFSNRRKFEPQNALAGHSRITFSSFDPILLFVFTHGMRWIPLNLAGILLLALPHSLAAAHVVAVSGQSAPPEGNLPASRYLELRTQTLAHSRLIAGPRLRNPNLAAGGLDRSVATALAEQRANRLNRAFTSSPAGTTLLSDRPATLLSLPTSTQPTQARNPIDRGPVLKRSSCSWPAIHAVNGKSSSPVFTPVEPDNHYRITGCAFGSAPGIVRLQPNLTGLWLGPVLQPITLQLDTLSSWSDDHIDVHINPGLTGVPDFTADLVIQFPNGRSIQLTRCQFLAARGEPQLLRAIPAAWVRLDATSLSARAIHQVEFESPPVAGEEIPPEAVGSSAFIARSDLQAFATGKDSYDLSQLAPGWVVESVQLRVFDAVCPGESKLPVSNGSWETSWTPRGFVISWADETCASPIPPVFTFSLSSSQYATNVWVVGPVGTQPLSSTFNAGEVLAPGMKSKLPAPGAPKGSSPAPR